VKECLGGPAPPLAIDTMDVDVDVVVDLVVDTTGHPRATDTSHFGLGGALGTSGASCLWSLGRVHVHDHVHVHVAKCPPDTFTGSQPSEWGRSSQLLTLDPQLGGGRG